MKIPHATDQPCGVFACGSTQDVMVVLPGYLLCAGCREQVGFCVTCGGYRLDTEGHVVACSQCEGAVAGKDYSI